MNDQEAHKVIGCTMAMNFGREKLKKYNEESGTFENVSPDFDLERISSSNGRILTLPPSPLIQTKPNQANLARILALPDLGMAQAEESKNGMTVEKIAIEKKPEQRLKDLSQARSDRVLHSSTNAQIKKPLKKRMTDLGHQLRSYTQGKREAEQEGKHGGFQETT